MQQDADLARLARLTALPLTLLAQWAGTAIADTGSIDHAQATIGLSTLFMGTKRMFGWTEERSIWLEREIVTGEATSLPC